MSNESAQSNSGAEMIAAERERQVLGENFTSEQDDDYTQNELIRAAKAYIAVVEVPSKSWDISNVIWPWCLSWFKAKADDPIPSLVKAGALIPAEIDRRKRKEEAERL